MAVLTTDILVENTKRNEVLEWLSKADNHDRILQGAWSGTSRTGERTWDLTFSAFPKKRTMPYTFERVDDAHGGRRVLCSTGGKRTSGTLSYSLRTPRASRHTMVTLHLDYDPGSVLGAVLDGAGLREGLEGGMRAMLQNLERELCQDLA